MSREVRLTSPTEGDNLVTVAVTHLLASFDALSDAEKHEAVAEILRRAAPRELPDDAFVELADELFRELDAREAADAKP